jgi:hypothetical protein
MARRHKLHKRYGKAGAPREVLERLYKGSKKAAETLARKIRALGGKV